MTLTDGELAGMCATLHESLPEIVDVSRATRVTDAAGGLLETWATVATLRGRLAPEAVPPAEPTIGERPGGIVRWQWTLPAGSDVRANDRILFGARTFEVRGIDGERSFEIAVLAHCSEIL